jgi:predicted RNase H-like nuclease (RuvC/YqgF family)
VTQSSGTAARKNTMSEVTDSIFIEETTEQRVEGLAGMVREIDEDYAKLASRVSTVEALREETARLHEELRYVVNQNHELRKSLESIRNEAKKAAADHLEQIGADNLAEALQGRVLTVRPANREEQKTGKVLAVRHVR